MALVMVNTDVRPSAFVHDTSLLEAARKATVDYLQELRREAHLVFIVLLSM